MGWEYGNDGPPRPKGYVRHNSDASDSSNSVNLHSLPPPEPHASQGGQKSKKCLLLSLAILVVVAVAVGLSLGLTTVAKNNSEINASASTSGSNIDDTDTTSALKDGTVKSVKAFYAHDEEIRLRFIDPIPHEDHWIGITRAKADEANLLDEDIIEWMFACGTQNCIDIVDSGKVRIPKGKLRPGRYRAHLLVNSEAPFKAIASSKTFVISPDESVEEVEKDTVVTASPTSHPTKKPTKKPTNKPTIAPTATKVVEVEEDEAAPFIAESTIRSKHSTYGKKHNVHVSFTNADAQRLDWIAIAKPGSEDGNRLDEKAQLVAWIYACGSASCSRKKDAGNLTFDGGVIPPGTWQAYLVKNDKYSIKAKSEPFTIVKGDFDQNAEAVTENRGS